MASKFHFHAFQAKEMEISSDLLRLSLKETPLEGGGTVWFRHLEETVYIYHNTTGM